ncbi:hypothetical protein J5N97_022332 [Dioscorea zingiberensis]|uniref:Uncharacterized protein n=1 Tax=Dioscorea zingiberensis TaxID=325984 RepID=A0A9D5CB10_9LILI|nr:hypothetical protein J5N97_022332 [Dioscorea zingiberensis]
MPSKEEFSIGNQFSFSSPLYRVELNTQSERIHGKFSYFGSPETEKFRWWPEEEEEEDEEEELDVVIPHNAKSKDDQHCFACTSRVEEIAKHRREMLEMVEDLPEFAYELSLKDMVELPAKIGKEISREREEVWIDKYSKGEEDKKNKNKKNKKKKKKNERIWLKRSNSVDSGGFLLKIFLPVNLSGKKSSGTPSPTSKVSPKPLGIGAVDKAVEEEKKFEKNHGSRWLLQVVHLSI